MEYIFRKSNKVKETLFRLGQYSMEVVSDKASRTIPYEGITDIRLKRKGKLFSMTIKTLAQGTLMITNRSYQHEGKLIDQSRAYMTFVRVIHMHLHEKGKVSFRTGFVLSHLLLQIIGIAGITMLVLFCMFYFDLAAKESLFIAIPIIIMCILIGFGLWIYLRLRSYHPTQIPLHLLPSTT